MLFICSEEQYGDLFLVVSEVITKLFLTSHKVLITLTSVLMENVNFNCLFEDELTLLTEGIFNCSVLFYFI